MSVAEWRYIQSIHETAELQNPDTFVRHFLPALRRWRCVWLGQSKLAILRSNPFYFYLVARTKYYDGLFLDAISDKRRYIINAGCGCDTRSYRFEHILKQHGVKVLECDQAEAIAGKQRSAKRFGTFDHITYLSIDMNEDARPEFKHELNKNSTARILVLMEGVSPYINVDSFGQFLSFLARELPAGSRVVYDFKFVGGADSYGIAGRIQRPFRLPTVREAVVSYHEKLGYRVNSMERSSELSARLLTGLAKSGVPLFTEDGLIQLEVAH